MALLLIFPPNLGTSSRHILCYLSINIPELLQYLTHSRCSKYRCSYSFWRQADPSLKLSFRSCLTLGKVLNLLIWKSGVGWYPYSWDVWRIKQGHKLQGLWQTLVLVECSDGPACFHLSGDTTLDHIIVLSLSCRKQECEEQGGFVCVFFFLWLSSSYSKYSKSLHRKSATARSPMKRSGCLITRFA